MPGGRDRSVEISQNWFYVHFMGGRCQNHELSFRGRAKSGGLAVLHGVFTWPNQEIYWLIALLTSDEPIKTLRGFVKRQVRRCNRKRMMYRYTQSPLTPQKKTIFGGAWITIA